jgi:hypothetical protein
MARLGAEVIKVEHLGGEETPKTSGISVAPPRLWAPPRSGRTQRGGARWSAGLPPEIAGLYAKDVADN